MNALYQQSNHQPAAQARALASPDRRAAIPLLARRAGLFFLVFVIPLTLAAQVLEPEALKRKQEEQQRAKAMTRELLNNVLDLQLRQLEENDLTDLEIYREIQLMRENLQDIVEAEMTKVVELLAKAQALPKDQREASFVEARQMIRTIVLTLSAERQNLLRRLKIAELGEQVRRLITLQTKVQNATKQLPQEAKARQEALTLKTVEDQRDVKELFLLLIETLTDVRTWGGALSNAAADGLKLMKAADVGKDIDGAGRALQGTQFTAAIGHQDAVLKGLRDLLKLLQRAQGVMGSDNQSALNKLQEIAKQQQALREETRKQDPAAKTPEALVEQQAKIQQEIAKLENAVQQQPQAEAHLEQAKASAEEATAKLFENQPEQAAAEQTKVLGQLAALEEVLKQAAPNANPEQSAAELAQLVRDLEQAQQQLVQAQQKQDEAAKQAETNAQTAAQPEAQVAAALDAALKNDKLPDSIEGRLEEAKTAAQDAAKELAQAAAEPAKEAQKEKLENAEDALDRAMAAVETALEDAQRRQAAVEIGELARAAEVLERAAAEERDIAAAAEAAAKAAAKGDSETTAEAAKQAAERQATVEAVAEKVAQGLQQTSPESAKDIAAGKEAAKQSEQALTQAADMAEKSLQQAKEQAQVAAEKAKASAEKFAAAAQQLREEIAETAQALADASETQADKLQAALAEVEKALKNQTPSPAERMEQLEKAQAKVAEAAKQQQIAAGKPEAAKAMDLAEKIAAASKAQDQAAESAKAAEKSDAVSPLQAAVEQQEAVERTLEAAAAALDRPQAAEAKQAGKDDALAKALKDAEAKAADAAKKLVDGNEQGAKAAQDAVQAALQAALNLAQAETRQAMEKPAENKPNPAAQDKANQAAELAQKFATVDAPAAAETLAGAVEAGKEARQDLVNREPEKAAPAQQKSMQALNNAAKNIEAAMNKLAEEQAKQLEQQAQLAEQLGDETAGLDLGTAEALDAAKEIAQQGAKPDTSPQQRAMSAERAQRNLERAAANLATKEQAVRRDQAVADALSDLAEDQKAAAEVIADQRDEEMTEPSAAEALAEATEKFAEAQEALGQGAVELSGQVEVANRPLREALELASEFPSLKDVGEDLHRMPMDAAHGQMPEEKPAVAETDKPAEGDAEAQASDDTPDDATTTVDRADDALPNAQSLDLGTKFVPKSANVTAKMMAGPEARAAMKAAEAKLDDAAKAKLQRKKANAKNSALAKKMGRTEKTDLLADAEEPELSSETQESTDFSKKQRSETDNLGVKDGPPVKLEEGTKAADSRGDKAAAGNDEAQTMRKFREAPWFAKLPPELRKSIRANAQQRAPRAYEEKLRKYFESVD